MSGLERIKLLLSSECRLVWNIGTWLYQEGASGKVCGSCADCNVVHGRKRAVAFVGKIFATFFCKKYLNCYICQCYYVAKYIYYYVVYCVTCCWLMFSYLVVLLSRSSKVYLNNNNYYCIKYWGKVAR